MWQRALTRKRFFFRTDAARIFQLNGNIIDLSIGLMGGAENIEKRSFRCYFFFAVVYQRLTKKILLNEWEKASFRPMETTNGQRSHDDMNRETTKKFFFTNFIISHECNEMKEEKKPFRHKANEIS